MCNPPDLIGDRFLAHENGIAVDLATGEEVFLRVEPAGNAGAQAEWMARCDRLYERRHRALARLLDYGATGPSNRFEAWRCGGRWPGSRALSDAARANAAAYLAATGLTPPGRHDVVRTDRCMPVVVPGSGCGLEASPAGSSGLANCGLRHLPRRAVGVLADLLTQSSAAVPRAVSLWGPPLSGVRTAVLDVARAARLHGFVPLSAGKLAFDARSIEALLAGRSLLLIASDRGAGGWRSLLRGLLSTPLPHVLLLVGHDGVPQIDGLPLDLPTSEMLVEAIEPQPLDSFTRRRIEDAARRSGRLPGRFARLLWGDVPKNRDDSPDRPSRAAEVQPQYVLDIPLPSPGPPLATAPAVWPAPGELPALRRRLDAGLALCARGRHAPGGRTVRQAIGALVRRNDWHHAAKGELALGAHLLSRGRVRDAEVVLNDAREHADKAGPDATRLSELAILSANVVFERGRLDEAETILRGAVAAARAVRDPVQAGCAAVALARCLFWRGRYDEASHVLAAPEPAEADAAAVATASLRARIAVGRGDLATGVSEAVRALSAAEDLAIPTLVSDCARASALGHLAVGDLAALRRDISRAIAAARAAHDPLRALKGRLLEAEAARRSGCEAAPLALIKRIRRIPAGQLPCTVRARAGLLADLLAAAASPGQIVARVTASTGLHALGLFAPLRVSSAFAPEQAAIDDVLEVLQCLSEGSDRRVDGNREAGGILGAVCETLRKRLGSASVAYITSGQQVLAVDGRRIESDIAARVIAANQPIAPHLRDGIVEGGAPVKYGGEIIGALVARWTLASPCDPIRSVRTLTVAATASSPAVAEAQSTTRTSAAQADGIIGLSSALAEVRRTIERSAASPFSVLICGESGSGKELVARSIHRRSQRRDRPFCTLNCAALPDELVESELFGHARGAFTGAVIERPGVFEEAHTGTLFLDEIGELSARAQAKLLRTLQEGELRRVGENIARRVDVRIVAATNRDLAAEASSGRFRIDLLYRLDVVRIAVPPLRDRREDIALLAERFWGDATSRIGSRATLATATVAALARYDWPGNVRELQNVLAALAVRSPRRGIVGPAALPPVFRRDDVGGSWRLDTARRTFEERFVRAALVRTGGHRAHAALELGVTRQGLTKLLARLGISD